MIRPKVLSQKDIEAFFDIDKYQSGIKQHCDDLVNAAKIEAEKIRKDAYKSVLRDLHEQAKHLYQLVEEKNKQFITRIAEANVEIINSLCQQCGIDYKDFSNHHLALIKQQLEKYAVGEALVSANRTVIEKLQANLTNYNNLSFVIDDSLDPNECMYETQTNLIKIDWRQLEQILAGELIQE